MHILLFYHQPRHTNVPSIFSCLSVQSENHRYVGMFVSFCNKLLCFKSLNEQSLKNCSRNKLVRRFCTKDKKTPNNMYGYLKNVGTLLGGWRIIHYKLIDIRMK